MTYVVTAMAGFYLDVFVLVVQLFRRVPALKALAPTQSEPPFAAVQLVVLAAFVVLTVMASIRFKPGDVRTFYCAGSILSTAPSAMSVSTYSRPSGP
jgi:hypothetical protein